MNLYLLVEGKRTEAKLYPFWLSVLLPQLKRVTRFHEVNRNNYYLFNSNGIPSIYDDIPSAIVDINTVKKYHYFVICLDADELSVEERYAEIQDLIDQCSEKLNAKCKIVIQNRCIETWLLGNRKVFPRHPQEDLLQNFCDFYNVSTNDPELMPIYPEYSSISQFHAAYLTKMLKEKNIRYSKRNPKDICHHSYLDELCKRTDSTKHISTFVSFVNFCKEIQKEMTNK